MGVPLLLLRTRLLRLQLGSADARSLKAPYSGCQMPVVDGWGQQASKCMVMMGVLLFLRAALRIPECTGARCAGAD